MRTLLYTGGSPFARAVRIILDELGLEYERQEELAAPTLGQHASAAPTLQVPTLEDRGVRLWESGLIAEYLLTAYPDRPDARPPLADEAWRTGRQWEDKLLFSTIQTFGTAATTISQMTWTGVGVADNAHLERSASRMAHILHWLEQSLPGPDEGFMPGQLSIQDIFLACHIRFVEARPLGVDLQIDRYEGIGAMLARLDERKSFQSNPIWWWEPGVTSYEKDGTPIFG